MKKEDDPYTERHQTIDGLRFIMTNSMFPEQYDVFDGDVKVGYVRVRWGNFSVTCPNVNGFDVIDREVAGFGDFSEEERPSCLREAAARIREWQNEVTRET